MSKRHKSILVWIVSWAGLLLAVLYSPVGSPDMYSNKSFFAENQGVSFQEGRIENAPDVNLVSNDDNELNVPDYGSAELKTANYAVGGYQSSSSSLGSSYSTQNQTYIHGNASSNGLTGGGGSTFIASRGSGGSASSMSTGNNMTSDATTLSADINMSSSTRQSAGAAGSTAATDPGGDPDSGTAIPVPDGWGFLLLLAGVYAFVKTKYFTTIRNLFS